MLVSTVRTQGFTAVYRGLSALVIGTAAKAGVRFFAFDQFRDMLKDSEGKISAGRSVLGKVINFVLSYSLTSHRRRVS